MDFDKYYKRKPHVYGIEPSDWVVKINEYKKLPASVLDLGVGQGRNAIYLAKQGYEVTGVDNSKVGIKQCLREAKNNKVNLECVLENIEDYQYEKKFDVILSAATFHFLGNQKTIGKVIDQAKDHTKKSGLNVISVPTDTKIAMKFPYYFKPDELSKYYQDWKILESGEIEDLFSTGKIGTISFIIGRKV